jgi:hypothetical protein
MTGRRSTSVVATCAEISLAAVPVDSQSQVMVASRQTAAASGSSDLGGATRREVNVQSSHRSLALHGLANLTTLTHPNLLAGFLLPSTAKGLRMLSPHGFLRME